MSQIWMLPHLIWGWVLFGYYILDKTYHIFGVCITLQTFYELCYTLPQCSCYSIPLSKTLDTSLIIIVRFSCKVQNIYTFIKRCPSFGFITQVWRITSLASLNEQFLLHFHQNPLPNRTFYRFINTGKGSWVVTVGKDESGSGNEEFSSWETSLSIKYSCVLGFVSYSCPV